MTLLVPIVNIVVDFLQRMGQPYAATHLKSPLAGSQKTLVVACSGQFVTQEIIKVGIQPPAGYHSAVLALEGTTGRITRIGEQGFLSLLTLLVETVKRGPGHKHLAPYLERVRTIGIDGQFQGYAADGAHIGRHIIALFPVATGDSTHQPPVFVVKTDAEPVEFKLAAHIEGLAVKTFTDTLVKVGHLLTVVGIGKAEHGTLVDHGGKVVAQVAAHTLGGTIRVVTLRMELFELLQFMHHRVKLTVGHRRRIQHIVLMV